MAEGFTGRPVQVSASWVSMRGHAHGLRGPVLLGSIRWPAQVLWKTDALAAVLVKEGGLKVDDAQRCLESGLDVPAFFAIVLALETKAQSTVTQTGVSLARGAKTNEWIEHALAFPTYRPRFTHALIRWLASAINTIHSKLPPDRLRTAAKGVHAQLDEARSQLRDQQKAEGINTARISRACGELGLPWQALPGGVLHVGSGRNARLFKSTLTESTPALAAFVARSKSLTASMLRAQGMPVPRHKGVASADDAVAAAREFGFPVVVKPDDSDGGQGVYAGLMTEDQVRQCFSRAVAVSRNVLLEEHVPGQDFRITVAEGKVVKAIGRRPGGVQGDGRSSVEQLVSAEAARPGSRGSSSVVSLDGEALELLAEQGMSAQSVPTEGEFITLRRRANMSTGGTSRDALAALHPDNARLVVRAAQALRLDIAGVDLIIPDIAVSWLDCRAAICEVNAQPQISTEFAPSVYRDMLSRLVRDPVRLHTVLVLDASDGTRSDGAVMAAASELSQRGEQVLSIRSDGRWLGEKRVGLPARDAFSAAVSGELEVEATAAVAALTAAELVRSGVPWLCIDEVRVIGTPATADVAVLQSALALLAPHVVGGLPGAAE
ncbi:MAG TPA: hypothetical protein VK996_08495 [Ramlibacter sp.]|nr:hypothetical protein [Ramlibacter sp.]